MHDKTQKIIDESKDILASYEMQITVRQLYYQLVSKQLIENSKNSYSRLDRILTDARKAGLISMSAFVDRSKPLLKQSSWSNLPSFFDTVREAYHKSVWDLQNKYVEVWIEKDALAGVINPTTNKYDCYLAVGRGYQSLTNKAEAVKRFAEQNKPGIILYFGDFDPTGIDISRDLTQQMQELGADVVVERIALSQEQIKQYNLPPFLTKPGDKRTAKHNALYGELSCVELDALRPDVLVQLVEDSIMKYLDESSFLKVKEEEKVEQEKLLSLVEGF